MNDFGYLVTICITVYLGVNKIGSIIIRCENLTSYSIGSISKTDIA